MITHFNVSETSAVISGDAICSPRPEDGVSAIDAFYRVRDEVLATAFSPPHSERRHLRDLLVLALCSAAEVYFRRIWAESLNVCPIARTTASSQMVPMAAVANYGVQFVGLGISDTKGVTSNGEILNRTKALLGFQINPQSSVGVAVSEFEEVCQLRHALVHSGGELLIENRRQLKISRPGRVVVSLDDQAFQVVVQRVVNVIRAYNNYVANQMIIRWFTSGVMTRRWKSDRAKFVKLFSLFESSADGLPSIDAKAVYMDARGRIPS